MNREDTETAIKSALTFIDSAYRALAVADLLQDDYEAQDSLREGRAPRKVIRRGSDRVATGTVESGQLRRDSLDLTRALAKMRKVS
jgi:hypothetical protein